MHEQSFPLLVPQANILVNLSLGIQVPLEDNPIVPRRVSALGAGAVPVDGARLLVDDV